MTLINVLADNQKKQRSRRIKARRVLGFESMEQRLLMALDVGATMDRALILGPLTATRTLDEAISDPTDVDMYRIEVQSGQRIGFDIDTPTNGPGGLGSYLRIFDAQGHELAANNDRLAPGEPPPPDTEPDPDGRQLGPDGFDSYIEHAFGRAGTYFVGVSNWQHRTYNPSTGATALGSDKHYLTGPYSLVISATGVQTNSSVMPSTPEETSTVTDNPVADNPVQPETPIAVQEGPPNPVPTPGPTQPTPVPTAPVATPTPVPDPTEPVPMPASIPTNPQPAPEGLSNGFGEFVDSLNTGSEAILDSFVVGATSGVDEAVDYLNAGSEPILDSFVVGATSGVDEAIDYLPHGIGLQGTGAATVGEFVGAGANGAIGSGVFLDENQGLNFGSFVSGGAFSSAPGDGESVPDGQNVITGNFSWGAFAGVGGSVFLTNAQNVQDLSGSFSAFNADASLLFQIGSLQIAYGQNAAGQNIYVVSIGPPLLGEGYGIDVSGYPTYTLPFYSSLSDSEN